jgi:membrane protein implicated in regulation of membrane protease activity
MLGSQWFYITVSAVGFAFFLISIFFDDVLDLDEAFDFDADWLNIKVLAMGLIGFGAAGFLSVHYDVPVLWILAFAVLGFVMISVLSYKFVLKPLLRQQSNSAYNRSSYVGCTGSLTIGIRKDSWGEVQFTDVNGALVRSKATDADNQELPTGAHVLIIDIEPDSVIVTINTLTH